MRSTPSSHLVNLEAIKLIRKHIFILKLLNRDIFSFANTKKYIRLIGMDGIMSARGFFENSAMFREGTGC